MVREGEERGLDVYLTTVLPWNNGFPTAREPIDELNRLIEEIGEREDVPVLDFYAELDDPEAPGRMPSKLTIDGDHPSVLGYERLGRLVAAELAAAQG
jgi:lysophospholipase L1-like esterase